MVNTKQLEYNRRYLEKQKILRKEEHREWFLYHYPDWERLKTKMRPAWVNVIERYHGLIDHEPKNFKKLGEELGVSRERIRQIYNLAIARIEKLRAAELQNN